jgi:predicted TIM-barrel fold metal-dependent hydrolase
MRKREVYIMYGTGTPALVCAVESMGADKLLFGTDYPHAMGDVPKTLRSINELRISSVDKDAILFRNALKLLRL